MRGPRTRNSRRVLALLLALAALTPLADACTASVSRHSSIAPTPTPSTPTTRPCAGRDLAVALVNQAATSSGVVAVFRVTNHGMTPCQLNGYPLVTLVDRHSDALPIGSFERGDATLTSAPPEALVLTPAHHAYTAISAKLCPGKPAAIAAAAQLAPPQSSLSYQVMLKPRPAIGYCGPHDTASRINVAPYQRTLRQVFANGRGQPTSADTGRKRTP
jgi:hypothetical protein